MAKRYVLLLADEDLSEPDWRDLSAIMEKRQWKVKLIAVEGNRRAVIVKTGSEFAFKLRDTGNQLSLGRKRLRPVLTSGAIGNLKRRATEGATNGKIHE
ncbi:MAG TPA: hypothetical protein VEB87_04435 [Nitrososphaerales archaeon]|nr:hypothetical protein [Nitrososphaerales archaeon]